MPVEPWAQNLGLAGVTAVLLLFLGRSYLRSVENRVTEMGKNHELEIERLQKAADARLEDMRQRAQAWEATAVRREATLAEALGLIRSFQPVQETAVQLLRAIQPRQEPES